MANKFMNTNYEINNDKDMNKFLKRFLTEQKYIIITWELNDPLDVISRGDVETLTKVKGIGTATANGIIDKYNKSKQYSSIYVELNQYDLTDKAIDKLIEKYKSPKAVIDAIKADNYICLSEFFTAKTALQKAGTVDVGGIPRKYPEKFHVKIKMSKKVVGRINETLKAKTKKGGKK